MKKIMLAITATVTIMFMLLGWTINKTNDNEEPYILRAEVISVNDDVVSCEDAHENVWEFYSDENEWNEGNFVLLLMDDCNTSNPYDDEIVSVRFDPFAY